MSVDVTDELELVKLTPMLETEEENNPIVETPVENARQEKVSTSGVDTNIISDYLLSNNTLENRSIGNVQVGQFLSKIVKGVYTNKILLANGDAIYTNGNGAIPDQKAVYAFDGTLSKRQKEGSKSMAEQIEQSLSEPGTPDITPDITPAVMPTTAAPITPAVMPSVSPTTAAPLTPEVMPTTAAPLTPQVMPTTAAPLTPAVMPTTAAPLTPSAIKKNPFFTGPTTIKQNPNWPSEGWEVKASSNFGTNKYGEVFEPWKVFDGKRDTGWTSRRGPPRAWCQIKYPYPVTVKKMILKMYTNFSHPRGDHATIYYIEGSNDENTWEKLVYTKEDKYDPGNKSTHTMNVTSDKKYMYLRFMGIANAKYRRGYVPLISLRDWEIHTTSSQSTAV